MEIIAYKALGHDSHFKLVRIPCHSFSRKISKERLSLHTVIKRVHKSLFLVMDVHKRCVFNNDVDISSMQGCDDIYDCSNGLGTGNKRIKCLREESFSFCLEVITFLFSCSVFWVCNLVMLLLSWWISCRTYGHFSKHYNEWSVLWLWKIFWGNYNKEIVKQLD